MRQILVIGGTSGIGKGVAEYFVRQGELVTIVGSRKDGADVALQIGKVVRFIQVDVTSEAQVKGLFANLEKLDVLINSAGIYIGNDGEGLNNLSAQDFEHEWRVNTLGTFLMCKYAMPLLKQSKGNIVNIVSISGMLSAVDSIGYTSSKAATNMLTKNLALAYVSDGIRVNAVCPGPIDTPQLTAGFQGKLEGNPEYDDWIAHCPMKRHGTVKDVVKGVAYLADPENDYVTGTFLTIDGGYKAKSY